MAIVHAAIRAPGRARALNRSDATLRLAIRTEHDLICLLNPQASLLKSHDSADWLVTRLVQTQEPDHDRSPQWSWLRVPQSLTL